MKATGVASENYPSSVRFFTYCMGKRAQVVFHLPVVWTVLRHSPPRCEGISSGPQSDETGHMMSCRLGHAQLASMLIDRIPVFPQHSE